jgi:excisionase family DNA binding protein
VTDRLLTAREVADLLGFSPSTIVDWFERGELPGFRVGGRLRFRASEVEAWLELHRGGGGAPQTRMVRAYQPARFGEWEQSHSSESP